LGWSRAQSTLVLGAAITLLGAPAAFNIGVLDVMDQVANNVFLLSGGLALAIFVGWIMEDPIAEVSEGAGGANWLFLWRNLLRFVVPGVLIFILWNSVPKTFEAVAALFSG
jgi:NSS family neurotransmitter:Na+ symporter